jgi:ubiquinone biosynthesis monooxygenase Coq7
MKKNKARQQLIESMIRVDHAGEFGAKRIYEGQLAVLKNKPSYSAILHMKEQELEHLDYFEKKLVEKRVRPTALSPFWDVAGFALGAATGLMGEKAAMACTVAVESVIDEHYQEQIDQLSNNDEFEKELKEKMIKFREEELEHKQMGLDNNAEEAIAYPILSEVIKAGSKAAIFLAKRF